MCHLCSEMHLAPGAPDEGLRTCLVQQWSLYRWGNIAIRINLKSIVLSQSGPSNNLHGSVPFMSSWEGGKVSPA